MIKANKNTRISEIIFFVPFALYYIARTIEYTNYANEHNAQIFNVVKLIAYGLAVIGLAYNAVSQGLSKRILLTRLGILIFVLYQVIRWDERSVFVVLLFSFLFRIKDMKRYLRFCLRTGVIIYIATVAGSLLGIIPNVGTTTNKYGITWERFSLGFGYPGQTLMSLIPLVMMDIYLHKNKKSRLIRSLIWLVIVVALFTQSQTIMPSIVCVAYLGLANLPIKDKLLKGKRTYITFICCGISLLLIFLRYYGLLPVMYIDRLINYRLSLTITAIKKYGITLLGTGFSNIGNESEYLFLDSDYAHILITNGAFYLIICVCMFNLCIAWAKRQNDSDLFLIFMMIAVNSMVNNGMFNLVLNPFIIVLALAIKDNGRRLVKPGERFKWKIQSL